MVIKELTNTTKIKCTTTAFVDLDRKERRALRCEPDFEGASPTFSLVIDDQDEKIHKLVVGPLNAEELRRLRESINNCLEE